MQSATTCLVVGTLFSRWDFVQSSTPCLIVGILLSRRQLVQSSGFCAVVDKERQMVGRREPNTEKNKEGPNKEGKRGEDGSKGRRNGGREQARSDKTE